MAGTTNPPPAAQLSLWPLRLTLVSIWVLAALFCLAMFNGIESHEKAMKAIGRDSAPSIIAAQHIKTDLAEMHTSVANILLGEPGKSPDAEKSYEKHRLDLTDRLVEAAEQITYDDAERVPIRRMINELGLYECAVAKARLFHKQEVSKASAKEEMAASLQNYREAERIMREGLYPAADALDKVNRDELQKEYEQQQTASASINLWVLLTGGLLVVVLGGTLLYVRRVDPGHNLPLLAATLLTCMAVAFSLYAFRKENTNLRVVKEDAYDSLAVLWQARADAFDANGDESRWLLDRGEADKYEKAFWSKADKIAKVPAGMSDQQLLAAVGPKKVPEGFTGYLATEIGNITFQGEEEKAIPTLKTWLEYVAIDRQIRKLEKEGKHDEAVKLCLGRDKGQSDYAFAEFNKALGETIDINQAAFDRIVKVESPATLLPLKFVAPIAALAIALLAFFGLRHRMHQLDIEKETGIHIK